MIPNGDVSVSHRCHSRAADAILKLRTLIAIGDFDMH